MVQAVVFLEERGPRNRIHTEAWPMDESDFHSTYVPEHLKERVANWRNLSIGERLFLTSELSVAAWVRIGVVHDPSKPMDKSIRRVTRNNWVGL
jgi:hypothetical protein